MPAYVSVKLFMSLGLTGRRTTFTSTSCCKSWQNGQSQSGDLFTSLEYRLISLATAMHKG